MYKLSSKRWVIAIIVLMFSVLTFNVDIFAQFKSSADSAILMEASTGNILYEKNADVSVPPASITKIMTLLIGLEAIEDGRAKWDDSVPISEAAWRMEGSKMFLEVGHTASYSDIITGISVVSANDGCVALAEYLYGSENAFVQAMNQKAKELGLTNTNFVNSNGLPAAGHVMSAKDIGTLARYLVENHPKVLELESQREFTFNGIRQFNRNPLLGIFQGADGLKTGWTEEAGYCLVATAKQNDVRMISVVLNTKNEKERQEASEGLLTYGFKNFEFVEIIKSGEIVDSIEIKNGKAPTVNIKVDSDIKVFIPTIRKNDIKLITVKNPAYLSAPVLSGTNAGKLEVQLDGKTLATADVSTTEEVKKMGMVARFFQAIGKLISAIF